MKIKILILTSEPAFFADRGYTSHKYLEDFKLYNMNGRLYDPVVGRFLNADPVNQDPGNTQNYNRYSYCLNNPLKYTDSSGMIHSHYWLKNQEDGSGGGTSDGGGGSFGGPGQGENGQGLNGLYYDWDSGTMRTTDGGINLGWGYTFNAVSGYSLPGTKENLASVGVDVISSSYISYVPGANGAMTGAQLSSQPTNAQLIFFEMGGKTFSTITRLGNGSSSAALPGDGDSFLGDALTFTEKHFNGGLGTIGVSVKGYNKLPNGIKRAYAYKLSKMTGIKSGKIFQGAKGFANTTGKLVSKLGPFGTVLGGGVITYEVMSGTWDAHTVVNSGLMIGAGVATFFAAPAVLTGIAIYGVGDYFFDFGDTIDKTVGRNSGVWRP